MSGDLLQKVTHAIEATGFPLEMQTAVTARRLGWIDFHSVEYPDPETRKLRELDLMFYMLIGDRRIELRVSCKSSKSKQFVFFTRRDTYIHNLSDLKITPICNDPEGRRSIPSALKPLLFFSHGRRAVNYTVLAGDKVDREARALLRDAIMSVVTSIHYRILPADLMFDQRGTVYLFLVVLKGEIFDAKYDEATDKMVVERCEYARWRGLIPMPQEYYRMKIPDADGRPVPFSNALYWFGNDLHIEFVKSTFFESYLRQTEECFSKLNPDAYKIFGKPWTPENFPKVGPYPSLDSAEGGNRHKPKATSNRKGRPDTPIRRSRSSRDRLPKR